MANLVVLSFRLLLVVVICIAFVDHLDCLGAIPETILSLESHFNFTISKANSILRKLYNTGLMLPNYIKKQIAPELTMQVHPYGLEVYSTFGFI